MTSPELIQLAREHRKNPTAAESLLWTQLRNRRLEGVKFRRQHPFEGFILDFYCPAAMLGIELDGGVHRIMGNAEYDHERSEVLAGYGILILRFWNSEVTEDLEKVVGRILITAIERVKELQNE